MDPLKEDAIHHERLVKIVCVGAGISGLCLAYKLRRSFVNYSLTVRTGQSISKFCLITNADL